VKGHLTSSIIVLESYLAMQSVYNYLKPVAHSKTSLCSYFIFSVESERCWSQPGN